MSKKAADITAQVGAPLRLLCALVWLICLSLKNISAYHRGVFNRSRFLCIVRVSSALAEDDVCAHEVVSLSEYIARISRRSNYATKLCRRVVRTLLVKQIVVQTYKLTVLVQTWEGFL